MVANLSFDQNGGKFGQRGSAARVAPQIVITTTGTSVGKENEVAEGSDDGDDDSDDIITEAILYAGVPSLATSTNPSSPGVTNAPPAPICTCDSYKFDPVKRKLTSTNTQDEGIRIH